MFEIIIVAIMKLRLFNSIWS